MQLASPSLPGARRPDHLLIGGTVGVAWIVTVVLFAMGGGLVDHDAVLADRRFGPGVSLLLFIASWQLMTAAMMLPSSLPMMVMFPARIADAASGEKLGIFMLGYFAIWTAFAVLALAGDAVVHWLAGNVRAVGDREWLIGGSILVLAGAFQFSSLKETCLDTCRDPVTFFWKHYVAGSRSAWILGLRHGVFCLGCCWALMLTMFAVGMGSLVWMTTLTGIMAIEKVTRHGKRLSAPVGVGLIAWGVLVVLHPDWLPSFIGVL